MKILISGLSIFLISFIIHIILWRCTNIKKSPANVVIVFGIIYALILAIFLYGFVLKSDIFLNNLFSIIHSYILASALFCAYLLSYPAIESESPSGIILLSIEEAGREGKSESQLRRIVTDELLTKERISCLLRDDQIKKKEGKYLITVKGMKLLAIFKFIKKVYNLESFKG